ncbi:MAG TPA: hypothetical protein VLC95_06005 [Anaerolineae bacterium]|jgi:hypothetical protein|nr:hypothetical protein [Anaerolineae bacterium]
MATRTESDVRTRERQETGREQRRRADYGDVQLIEGYGEGRYSEGYRLTAEDIEVMVEDRVRTALDEAMMRGPSTEIAEPHGWWNLFALGPVQPIGVPAPLQPHQVIKVGEPAFIATVLFLNPFLTLSPGTTAADVLSNFALPYEIQYQTGNLTTWTLGPGNMNVVHNGAGTHLIPGQFVYVDVLGFTANTAGMYEMNITARLLGAAPPHVNAPQFAGFARAVIDFDPDLFISGAPGVQFDQPIRFQVYP